jgi:hypothetical protein
MDRADVTRWEHEGPRRRLGGRGPRAIAFYSQAGNEGWDREFESTSLQRRVRCELTSGDGLSDHSPLIRARFANRTPDGISQPICGAFPAEPAAWNLRVPPEGAIR